MTPTRAARSRRRQHQGASLHFRQDPLPGPSRGCAQAGYTELRSSRRSLGPVSGAGRFCDGDGKMPDKTTLSRSEESQCVIGAVNSARSSPRSRAAGVNRKQPPGGLAVSSSRGSARRRPGAARSCALAAMTRASAAPPRPPQRIQAAPVERGGRAQLQLGVELRHLVEKQGAAWSVPADRTARRRRPPRRTGPGRRARRAMLPGAMVTKGRSRRAPFSCSQRASDPLAVPGSQHEQRCRARPGVRAGCAGGPVWGAGTDRLQRHRDLPLEAPFSALSQLFSSARSMVRGSLASEIGFSTKS